MRTALAVALLAGCACAQKPVLVRDLCRETVSGHDSRPRELTWVGQRLFFSAFTKATGRELFASVGGIQKPYLVKDLNPGASGADIRQLCAAGNLLFFAVGAELWRSDGSSQGTTRVKSLAGSVQRVFSVGSRLVVIAGSALYLSDGTAAGTQVVPGRFSVTDAKRVGPALVFANQLSGELWWTDGTLARTGRLTGFRSLFVLGALGHRVFFVGASSSGGTLWVSDGTSAGTKSLGSYLAIQGVAYRGRFYFVAAGASGQQLLCRSDGTRAGTVAFRGMSGHAIGRTVVAGKNLFFVVDDGLWHSDGSKAGTTRVAANVRSSTATAFGDQVVYVGYDPREGNEPWVSDGTQRGTRRVAAVRPGLATSDPVSFTAVGGGYVSFVATDGVVGRELFATDGTQRNTFLVADLDPTAAPNYGSNVRVERDHGGLTMMRTHKFPPATYVTDGTPAGTRLVAEGSYKPLTSASLGATICFGGRAPAGGTGGGTTGRLTGALYAIDGRTKASRVVRTFSDAEPAAFARLGEFVYFGGADKSGVGLWRTDGTARGTRFVAGFVPMLMTAFAGRLYFVTSGSSPRLFESDGTTLGTRAMTGALPLGWARFYPAGDALYLVSGNAAWRVRDREVSRMQGPRSYFVYPQPDALVEWRGVTYFLGSGRAGAGLWRTDGTDKGTVLVRQVSVPRAWDARMLVATDDSLFFIGESAAFGRELWNSDGTAAGTSRLKDIAPGALHGVGVVSNSRSLVAVGHWVYFAGATNARDYELWRSDGTAQNTRRVYDLTPGPMGGGPGQFLLSRGSLLFVGSTPATGAEPFRVAVPAHASVLGPGCAVAATPRVRTTAPTLGASVVVTVDRARAAAALVRFGFRPAAPVHVGRGCVLYADPVGVTCDLPVRLVGGVGRLRFAVPTTPSLHGVDCIVQAAVGPTKNSPLGIDLSNGLLLAVRR